MARINFDDRNEFTGLLLGVCGYLPFAVLVLCILLPSLSPFSQAACLILLIGWSALVLSFLGGIRYGLATARNDGATARELLTSVVAPLLAWITLTLPTAQSLALLCVAFVWHYFWDYRHGELQDLPRWFVPLRKRITLLVVPTLLVAMLAFLV